MESSPDDRCGYVWSGGAPEVTDRGHVSCCYRETVVGSNRCRWHATDVVGGRLHISSQPAAPTVLSTDRYRRLLDGAQCRGVDFGTRADLRSVALREADLSGASLVGADLSGATLTGADLRGADLRRATLVDVDLRNADLRGADLTEARLQAVEGQQAVLDEATCRQTHFEDVRLQDASLRNVDFSESSFDDVDGRRATLDGAICHRADLTDVRLQDASLRGTDLSEAAVAKTDARNAALEGLILTEAVCEEVRFSEAVLQHADLSRVQATELIATEAELNGASLEEADLSGSVLVGADLTGANLSSARLDDASLSDVTFRDADLQSTSLKASDLSEAILATATLREAALTAADLTWANLSGADCRGADFSEATLTHARLENADLRNTTLKQATLYEATFENARLNAKTTFTATVGDDPPADIQPDSDTLERAEWAHWKVHSLLSDYGLYRQAAAQKHHLTEARLKTQRAMLSFRSAVGLRARLRTGGRYLRYRTTAFGIRLGEHPSLLVAITVLTVLLGAVAYPVFGVQHDGVIYRYAVATPSLAAVIVTLSVSLNQVLVGILTPPEWLFGVSGVIEPVVGLFATDAVPVGTGSTVQVAQRGIGVLLTLLAGVIALQRLILYTRKRAGPESYGGIVSWLFGR